MGRWMEKQLQHPSTDLIAKFVHEEVVQLPPVGPVQREAPVEERAASELPSFHIIVAAWLRGLRIAGLLVAMEHL